MFSNLKVVELATVLAGLSVGMFFAELGAEVVKIEHPAYPDVTRSWKLPSENANDTVSAYFSSVNYKKKYIRLNLKELEDLEKAKAHIKTADILLMNFKKGDDVKFGLTSDELQIINPRLIIGKISGYGCDSDRVAYDLILQAETGFMSMNGTPESGPVKMPVALIDVLAAHQLKEGILIALCEREKNQKGKTISVSLYDAAISSLINQAANFLMEKHIPQRIGSLHPNIAPYGELFHTKDQQIITFAVGSNVHFEKLMHILALDDLAKKYPENQDRLKNREIIAKAMQESISLWDCEPILNTVKKQFIPVGKIKNLAEVFSDESAQQMVREEHIEGRITKRVSSIAFKTT